MLSKLNVLVSVLIVWEREEGKRKGGGEQINADLGMMYMQMNNPGKPRQLKDTPEQRDNLLSALRHCHIGLHSETPHFYYGGDVSEGELWRIHPDDDYEFIAKVREEIAYCGDRKALRTEIERVQGQYKEPEHMSTESSLRDGRIQPPPAATTCMPKTGKMNMSMPVNRIDYLEGILDKLRAENDKVFMQCDATEAVNRLGDTPEKGSRSEYLEIEIAKARIEKERLREECRRKETKDEL
ncbi:hypothetical protein PRIPAC_95051 [Pristionchus pacificus]|uniref:Uncharacterized protein n=1 Tax=Pristionchus pacificus TaxID=54126 RepID=A0A2A6CDN3_PRIPA|nr:hypothetical protein PRIPAC_95051 [Pristionchus pacificus]|eukprot:PDM76200.1 hypothetical protein PRIPAC_39804 [Pristionchus pacificus]